MNAAQLPRTRYARKPRPFTQPQAQIAKGAELVNLIENWGRVLCDPAPYVPPMQVAFSATIENADYADINIKVTR